MEISWVGFGAVVMVSAVISIFSFVNERRPIYPVDDFGLLQLYVGPFFYHCMLHGLVMVRVIYL